MQKFKLRERARKNIEIKSYFIEIEAFFSVLISLSIFKLTFEGRVSSHFLFCARCREGSQKVVDGLKRAKTKRKKKWEEQKKKEKVNCG